MPLGIARRRPALHLLDEPGLLGLARRAREPRHVGAVALGEGHVAALGDGQSVVAGLRQVGEQRAHLRRRLQVVAVALELEPVRVGHRGGRLDAEQHLVRGRLGLVGVVQVVGGDERQLQVAGRSPAGRSGPGSRWPARGPSARRSSCPTRRCRGTRRRWPALRRTCRAAGRSAPHRRAAGGRDQPGRVLRQQLAVHPGLVEVALERGQRGRAGTGCACPPCSPSSTVMWV